MSEISQERQVELNNMFSNAETASHYWEIVLKMTDTELRAVKDALTIVRNILGLTMRDRFILRIIEVEVKQREIESSA